MRQWMTAGVGVLMSVLASVPASAQLYNKREHLSRINASYTPNPTGAHYQVRNRDGFMFNFSVADSAGGWSTIPMADPTILRIDDTNGVPWYYVTGTSDGCSTGNFMIYKSRDLLNWLPHATAWPDEWRDSGANETATLTRPFRTLGPAPGGASIDIGTESYAWLWAPSLIEHGGNVFLTFTAHRYVSGYDYPVMTCWLAYTATEDFVKDTAERRGSTDISTLTVNQVRDLGYFGGPVSFRYQISSNTYADGGAQYHPGGTPSTPVQYTVPTSGYWPPTSSAVGQPEVANGGWRFKGMDPDGRSWMQLDSFLYKDAADGGKGYVMFTYSSPGGLATTAFPLNLTQGWNRPDGTQAGGFVDIARGASSFDSPGIVPGTSGAYATNGAVGPWGGDYNPSGWLTGSVGVAEGGSAFRYNNRTYVMYSRNAYNSPAYGIYYRVSDTAGDLADMGLPLSGSIPSGDEFQEHRLVAATNRLRVAGPSFGHGEVFFVKYTENNVVVEKPYLIFHAKEEGQFSDDPMNPLDPSDNIPDFEYLVTAGTHSAFSGRTIYFKELNIDDTTGEILALRNDNFQPATDTDVFRIPAALLEYDSEWWCHSDFNRDGDFGTDADIEDFFRCLTTP